MTPADLVTHGHCNVNYSIHVVNSGLHRGLVLLRTPAGSDHPPLLIGSEPAIANDVGEIRRVLNSFLQMIEQDRSHSMVMAATNHPRLLDRALFRRFDDILQFDLPDESQIAQLLKMRLARAAQRSIAWNDLASRAVGLSYGEITRATNDVIKDALVSGRSRVREEEIRAMLEELKATREWFG